LGRYFSKKQYTVSALPNFEQLREQLPFPVFDANPLWVRTYWKAWELAFKNFHEPAPGSGFVSQFIDAAFNQNIFLWDSCFMAMFCNYAYPLVPGISTLDNFYAKQHKDGEICREIGRNSGVDFGPWTDHEHRSLFSRWGWPGYQDDPSQEKSAAVDYEGRTIPHPPPKLTLDALDHPIFAWAELEAYRVTGNKARLEMVWEPLVHYYGALQKYLAQGNGLYVTDWASMDNSPRNRYLKGGGTGIDISSEMALFGRQLAEVGGALGKHKQAEKFSRQADALAALINRYMWDPKREFYFDLTLEGERAPVKTVAAYWALLAKVAEPAQAGALVKELNNPVTFGRRNSVPTLAADEPGYNAAGGYWRGSVWAPTQTMVIRGLENYGYSDRARELALSHLDLVAQVFKKTGTIWENYAPDAIEPGKPAKGDFVGWSGIGPIMYLFEYAIGLKPDAPHNQLTWVLQSEARAGCERFRFNGHVTSLVAEPVASEKGKVNVTVESDGDFKLQVRCEGKEENFSVVQGKQQFMLDVPAR
jgi:glycogen debranching enzyme